MRTLGLLVLAAAAWAQVDPDTITVTSRSSRAPAGSETVSYTVTVTAVMEKGLDDVLQAVAAARVSERDLTSVSWPSQFVTLCTPGRGGCSPPLVWSFRFTSPVERFSDTIKALTQMPPSGMSVSYSAESGGGAATPECAYPTLISQARRHAENLAAAAGLRAGRITALSDVRDEPAPTYAFSGVFLVGIPMTLARFVYDPSTAVPAPTPGCAVAVQFQLLR